MRATIAVRFLPSILPSSAVPGRHPARTRPPAILAAVLSAGLVAFSCAGATAQAQQVDGTPPREIKVNARKNPGDLPYRQMYDLHQRLLSYLPPEPRMFDPVPRIAFTQLALLEQDAYEPGDWGVSIVGDSVDQVLPTRRGGYFDLPYVDVAYKEKATLMFRERSRRNYIEEAWVMRIGTDQRLRYADFGKAMDQLRTMQKAIPFRYVLNFSTEKFGNVDGLKACFLAPGARLLVDGKPAADLVSGHCSVLKFDPARAGSEQVIEFDGQLDIVTLIRTEAYLRDKG